MWRFSAPKKPDVAMMKKLRGKDIALLIVCVFTLLQFAVLIVFGYTPYPDSESYIETARQCIDEGTPYPAPSMINIDFVWNTGAINMAVLSLWLTGSVTPLLIIYTLMKGAACGLVYLIARRLAGQRIALIALVLYAVYPANYGEATSVQSEVPFIFFSLLGILGVVCRRPVSGGMSLGLGNWFRPLGLVFLLSCCVYIVLKKTGIWRGLVRMIAGYAAVLLVIGTLSYFTTGHFICQAGSVWVEIMKYSRDNDRDKTNGEGETYVYGEPLKVLDMDISYGEKEKICRRDFLVWVRNNKAEYLYQMKKKLIDLYCSDNVNLCAFIPGKRGKAYMYGEISMNSLIKCFPAYSPVQILTVINLLYYYLLMLLFIISVPYLLIRRHYDWVAFALCITVLTTLLLLLFSHGEARYHVPLMPFIIIADAALISVTLPGRTKIAPPVAI
ncbi:MAG: hypothetical protein LUC22_01160 [Prevotella sp.]|nr:hypothetical protein [Prevotella sp.]